MFHIAICCLRYVAQKYANQFRSLVPVSLLMEQREEEKNSDRGMSPNYEKLKLLSRHQDFRQLDH